MSHPVLLLGFDTLRTSYLEYAGEFRRLTRRAKEAFAARDWTGLAATSEERLLLYPKSVAAAVHQLAHLTLWHRIPIDRLLRRFRGFADGLPDGEVAKTYYNSIIRRLLGTVGVSPASEFLEATGPSTEDGAAETRGLTSPADWEPAVRSLLEESRLGPWADLDGAARAIVARLNRELPELARGGTLAMVAEPFIRSRRAFLVGRLTTDQRTLPVAIAVVHGGTGLHADALLLSADDVSIVFGFTRSYFHADLPAPAPVVGFLRALLPSKRVDEIYTVLGYHRHGKREFFQEVTRVLSDPGARFLPAEGVPGLVMVVFALDQVNAVFKVIRDQALPPKLVNQREVRAKYQEVFLTEHGGRLPDAQEFEGLAFPRAAFADPVADALLCSASGTVRVRGDDLVFDHLYVERRVTPLDVYLRRASPEAGRAAVADFGRAIKELAALNVFPGDMLTKNFGVTRHGRVVFYDYDEVCPLLRCTFRTMPGPRSEEDEWAAEPWFPVRENDIFPEEFERFLRFPEPLHQWFRSEHGDLFAASYWQGVQEAVRRQGPTDPAPYPDDRRI